MLWTLNKAEKNGDSKRCTLTPVSHMLHYEEGKRRIFVMPGEGAYTVGLDDPSMFSGNVIRGTLEHIERLISPARKESGTEVEVYLHAYASPYEKDDAYEPHYRTSGRNSLSFEGRRAGALVAEALVSADEKQQGISFTDLSMTELKRRLSHVTFVGYSYGTVQNQDVVDYLGHELARATENGAPKWSAAEIRNILQELVAVNIANVARIDYPAAMATSYFFCAKNDVTAQEQTIERFRRGMDHLSARCGYQIDLRPGFDSFRMAKTIEARKVAKPFADTPQVNGYVITGDLPDTAIFPEMTQDGYPLCEIFDVNGKKGEPSVSDEKRDIRRHDLRMHLYGNRGMSMSIRSAVNHAVTREYNSEKGTSVGDGSALLFSYPGALDDCHISPPTPPAVDERSV